MTDIESAVLITLAVELKGLCVRAEAGTPPIELVAKWAVDKIASRIEAIARKTTQGDGSTPATEDSPASELLKRAAFLSRNLTKGQI